MNPLCLVFSTNHDALVALNQIDVNMGYPMRDDESGYEALTWDQIRKIDNEERWFFFMPDEVYMEGLVNYEIMEYNPLWKGERLIL